MDHRGDPVRPCPGSGGEVTLVLPARFCENMQFNDNVGATQTSGGPRSAADPPPPALINISFSTQYSVYGCCQKPDKLIMRRERDMER